MPIEPTTSVLAFAIIGGVVAGGVGYHYISRVMRKRDAASNQPKPTVLLPAVDERLIEAPSIAPRRIHRDFLQDLARSFGGDFEHSFLLNASFLDPTLPDLPIDFVLLQRKTFRPLVAVLVLPGDGLFAEGKANRRAYLIEGLEQLQIPVVRIYDSPTLDPEQARIAIIERLSSGADAPFK